MFQRQFIRRSVAIGASGAATLLLCALPAGAKESKRAVCTAAYVAYKSGLENQQSGRLREARDQFATCAQATTCGGLVPKCKALYEKLATEMPTVVPVVTDESGTPRVDVQVKVDGGVLCSQLDGKGIPVEPGLHEFTFSTDRGVFATEKVLVLEGQRNRPISVSMGGSRPAAPAVATAGAETKTPVEIKPAAEKSTQEPTTDKSSQAEKSSPEEPTVESASREQTQTGSGHWAMPRSVFPYLIGGVGLAGLAGGGLLTYWGNKDNTALENSTCKPNCASSNIDHIRNMYLIADISYGVGAAALLVTTWLFASSRAAESPAKPASHEAVLFGVQPTRSGAFASASGAF